MASAELSRPFFEVLGTTAAARAGRFLGRIETPAMLLGTNLGAPSHLTPGASSRSSCSGSAADPGPVEKGCGECFARVSRHWGCVLVRVPLALAESLRHLPDWKAVAVRLPHLCVPSGAVE